MQTVGAFMTAMVSEEEPYAFKDGLTDTTVKGAIERLNLRRPICESTSAYGHFGRPGLPWGQIIAP